MAALKHRFNRWARVASKATGHVYAFTCAVALILCWSLSYWLFPSFDTWQLVINTITTIVTFLMVFLIQNTQNRDTEALHAKLDELIRVNKRASDSKIGMEKQD